MSDEILVFEREPVIRVREETPIFKPLGTPLYFESVQDKLDERMTKRIARREVKKAASGLKVTQSDVATVLWECKGSLAEAARRLSTTRPVLKRYIQSRPSLVKTLADIKEEKKDIAEAKLFKQVENEYFPAIAFFLKTIGKDRGYTERATLEHELSENTINNAAALIEAMQKASVPDDKEERFAWDVLPLSEKTS